MQKNKKKRFNFFGLFYADRCFDGVFLSIFTIQYNNNSFDPFYKFFIETSTERQMLLSLWLFSISLFFFGSTKRMTIKIVARYLYLDKEDKRRTNPVLHTWNDFDWKWKSKMSLTERWTHWKCFVNTFLFTFQFKLMNKQDIFWSIKKTYELIRIDWKIDRWTDMYIK